MEVFVFDTIPFIDISMNQLSLHNPIPELSLKQSGYFPSLSIDDMRVMTSHVENALFRLSGNLRVMAPLPITTTARKSFLFLESFSLAQSDSGHYTERNDSDTFLLVYTYAGKGFLSYEGKEYHLQEGDGFLIDCRKHHIFRSEGMFWERCDLYFNGYTAESFFSAFAHDREVIFHSISGFQPHLEKLLQSYHRIQPDRDLQIHAGLTELLSWLLSIKSSTSPSETEETIYHLIQYLQSHFSEPINMDDLSKISSISKYHLSREFRRLTGYSPIEYLLMVRIENAGTLLRNTDLSIALVAEHCGINSEQYLCRQFQKHFGETPGRYRRLHKKSAHFTYQNT